MFMEVFTSFFLPFLMRYFNAIIKKKIYKRKNYFPSNIKSSFHGKILVWGKANIKDGCKRSVENPSQREFPSLLASFQ